MEGESSELGVPQAKPGEGERTALGCRAIHVSPPRFHLPSLSRLHPHTHTILTLLIQGKERLMLSAWTGHHKLFFLNRRKKHLPPTVTSSPPSSLLPSSLMRSHRLCSTEGTKDCCKAVLWGHRGTQGCTRFPYIGSTLQETESRV